MILKGAVLGSPISHSLSPVLHNAAFAHKQLVDLGVAGSYSAIEVKSGELATFMRERGSEFDYFSLTMPLKEELLSLGYQSSERAQKIQSANTLLRVNNQWTATTTDGSGFIAALAHRGITQADSVLILGAGATSRAIVDSISNHTSKITVMGRSQLRQELIASCSSVEFEFIRWTSDIDFRKYNLIVNTTPAGAADLLADRVPVLTSQESGEITFFDVIYKPWPTVLASKFVDSGFQVIGGLELLLYQGLDQLELVVGKFGDREVLATYLRTELSKAIS